MTNKIMGYVKCFFGKHEFVKVDHRDYDEECIYCDLVIKNALGYKIHWKKEKKDLFTIMKYVNKYLLLQ